MTYTAGVSYQQLALELHDSQQLPGTVSVIRCRFRDVPRLTVCRQGPGWVSGESRAAASEEIKTIACEALQWC